MTLIFTYNMKCSYILAIVYWGFGVLGFWGFGVLGEQVLVLQAGDVQSIYILCTHADKYRPSLAVGNDRCPSARSGRRGARVRCTQFRQELCLLHLQRGTALLIPRDGAVGLGSQLSELAVNRGESALDVSTGHVAPRRPSHSALLGRHLHAGHTPGWPARTTRPWERGHYSLDGFAGA